MTIRDRDTHAAAAHAAERRSREELRKLLRPGT